MTFQKNQIYTVTIEDIGTEGEGIGKIDGFSLFVKDALPGDVAKVRLTKVKKNYAYARLEEVLTPSPDRVEPPCPFHRQCGGCQIQALSYEKQLAFKQAKVENNLVRIGGFAPEKIQEIMEPIIGMDDPWRYRNKAQYPFGYGKDGKLITGFYAGRTHSIIANTDCLLGVPENKEILEIILEHMERYQVQAYDEKTGKGLVRHVLIRKGFSSGELMVCIVLNIKKTGQVQCSGEWIPEQNKLVDRLALIHGMMNISVNVNHEKTNVIMGEETHTVWGRDKIRDTMHLFRTDGEEFVKTDKSVIYEISPRSFYQVNSTQAGKLYSTALSYAGLTGKETVWDLYCGIGTISLFLAKEAGKVYGVEVIPEAVEDARENARKNNITNAEFFVGAAEKVLPEFYEKGKIRESRDESGEEENDKTEDGRGIRADMCHPDVIVVDPPRKGCDEVCLRTILRMQPKRVVYVSCDSATLARDLKVLCEGGYELKKGRVCDQFCQGVHVEVACCLQRKDF
ncbi:MAG: 23S rRNA (uracil(1939)-C(5))-methyltransferase RlmD [Lachnospiraceae bacterium]|nr:23S rRNA (uracil(1939)-C(5))-methyltransferase RlmD [Lachnospiraceae bacterium]